MERLLITKSGANYSATTAAGTANSLTAQSNLENLKDGSIVVFEANGTRATAAGAFTKTDTRGVFAVGMPGSVDTRVSPLVNWETLRYVKSPYIAPATQVTVMGGDGVSTFSSGAFTSDDIGLQLVVTTASTSGNFTTSGSVKLLRNVATGQELAASTDVTLGQVYEVIAAGTPAAWGGGKFDSSLVGNLTIGTKFIGSMYGIVVIDLEKETWERNKWEVSLPVTDVNITTSDMLDNIVNVFNNHPHISEIATAVKAGSDDGIIFEGVTPGSKFQILPAGLFYGTSVITDGTGASQACVVGNGTTKEILDLEMRCSAIEGRTSTYINDQMGSLNPTYSVPSQVVPSVNYVLYVLEWTDQREVAYPSNNANPMHKRLNIAVPSTDSTMITALDNLLANLVA